jgi:rhodanese-related sulfurtransferase
MSTRPDRIDPEIANEYLLEEKVVLVDARPRREIELSGERIAGSVPIDPGSGSQIDEALLALPVEKLIVAYCDEPGQAASARIARRARELGRGDASLMQGGFAAWKAAGLPTESIGSQVGVTLLESLSPAALDELCRLAFWLGLVPHRSRDWDETRGSMMAFLADLPRGVIERFVEFTRSPLRVGAPDDHEARVANLPEWVKARAQDLFGSVPPGEGRTAQLAQLIRPDESRLLILWLTWTGEIPRRNAWWVETEPGMVPV